MTGGGCTYLALFEKSPFLALFGLGALLVIAPLDGIAHRRHFGRSTRCSMSVCVERGGVQEAGVGSGNFGQVQSITAGKLACRVLDYQTPAHARSPPKVLWLQSAILSHGEWPSLIVFT